MTGCPFFYDHRAKRVLSVIVLISIIIVIIFIVGCTSKQKTGENRNFSENQTGLFTKEIQTTHIPVPVPVVTMPSQSRNQVIIVDFEKFLTDWNEKMHWNFSPQQIENYNRTLENGLLKKYQTIPGYLTLDIPDIKSFCLEVGNAIGLTKKQSEEFAAAADDDLRKDKIEFGKPLSIPQTKSE